MFHLESDTYHLESDRFHLASDMFQLEPDTLYLESDTLHLKPETTLLRPDIKHQNPKTLEILLCDAGNIKRIGFSCQGTTDEFTFVDLCF